MLTEGRATVLRAEFELTLVWYRCAQWGLCGTRRGEVYGYRRKDSGILPTKTQSAWVACGEKTNTPTAYRDGKLAQVDRSSQRLSGIGNKTRYYLTHRMIRLSNRFIPRGITELASWETIYQQLLRGGSKRNPP